MATEHSWRACLCEHKNHDDPVRGHNYGESRQGVEDTLTVMGTFPLCHFCRTVCMKNHIVAVEGTFSEVPRV